MATRMREFPAYLQQQQMIRIYHASRTHELWQQGHDASDLLNSAAAGRAILVIIEASVTRALALAIAGTTAARVVPGAAASEPW